MRTPCQLILLLALLPLLAACGSLPPTPAAAPTPPAPTIPPSPTISSLSYAEVHHNWAQIYTEEGYPRPTPPDNILEYMAADTSLQERLKAYSDSVAGTRIDWQGWFMGAYKTRPGEFAINGYYAPLGMSPPELGEDGDRDVILYFEEPDERVVKALTSIEKGRSIEFRGVIKDVRPLEGNVSIFEPEIVAVK